MQQDTISRIKYEHLHNTLIFISLVRIQTKARVDHSSCLSLTHSIAVTLVQIKTRTRNKSNDYFWVTTVPAGPNTHYPLPREKRKHFPSFTRYSENHNNTCAENQKIHGLKVDTLYRRHRKNLNMGAQLHIIPYKKPPKHFYVRQLCWNT